MAYGVSASCASVSLGTQGIAQLPQECEDIYSGVCINTTDRCSSSSLMRKLIGSTVQSLNSHYSGKTVTVKHLSRSNVRKELLTCKCLWQTKRLEMWQRERGGCLHSVLSQETERWMLALCLYSFHPGPNPGGAAQYPSKVLLQ